MKNSKPVLIILLASIALVLLLSLLPKGNDFKQWENEQQKIKEYQNNFKNK